MNPNLTDVSIILDRSGSMNTCRGDTIGGYNAFVKQQAADPGETLISLVQFDTVREQVYAGVPARDVKPLDNHTYVPRGSTALLDAIGHTIVATGKRLAALAESERPSKVLIVVITDGEENASQDFILNPREGSIKPAIRAMIEEQQTRYNWQFVFIGANQDAIHEASHYGIAKGAAMTYGQNSIGTRSAFEAAASYAGRLKSGASGQSLDFTDEERIGSMGVAGGKAP